MSCNMHCFAEVRRDLGKWKIAGNVFPMDDHQQLSTGRTRGPRPFDWQDYGMYGFLANVRNWSHVPVIAEPKIRLPEQVSREVIREWKRLPETWHDPGWLSVRQLLEFDYEQFSGIVA